MCNVQYLFVCTLLLVFRNNSKARSATGRAETRSVSSASNEYSGTNCNVYKKFKILVSYSHGGSKCSPATKKKDKHHSYSNTNNNIHGCVIIVRHFSIIFVWHGTTWWKQSVHIFFCTVSSLLKFWNRQNLQHCSSLLTKMFVLLFCPYYGA